MGETYKRASFVDLVMGDAPSYDEVSAVLKKASKTTGTKKTDPMLKLPVSERLKRIREGVNSVLGRYRGFVKVIWADEFDSYIERAVKAGFVSIDTETNKSLDPMTGKIVGLCLYYGNSRPAYVPLLHTVPETETLLPNQVTVEQASRGMKKFLHTKNIWHNAKFDVRFIYQFLGVRLPVWWDTMVGSQLLNENEVAKLKVQYPLHIDPTMPQYDIEHLFSSVPYEWVDPETFALYAATDAYDTAMLQKYQQEQFEQPGMEKLYSLFKDLEVPIVSVTAKMEDAGVVLDLPFVEKLNNKYLNKMQEIQEKIDSILEPHRKEIEHYQLVGKLDNPYNINSDVQLKILLYDILKTPVPEGYSRSTDKAVLKAIKSDFTKALLDYRHYSKLVSSFTSPLPGWVSTADNRLHAGFNQLGQEENNVRTGRFSSTRPNLQQAPSHDKTFRLMFKASTYENEIEFNESLPLKDYQEVECEDGWKFAKDLAEGDNVVTDDGIRVVSHVFVDGHNYTVCFE